VRKYLLLSADLIWAFASGFVAVFVRDNFEFSWQRMADAAPLAIATLGFAVIIFVAFGLHRSIWRYASLPDLMRIMAAVTVTILFALFAIFAHNRLEGIARSIPFIQWVILVGGLTSMRIFARLVRARLTRDRPLVTRSAGSADQVLVIGLNHLTELYIRSVAELAADRISVAGILAEGKQIKGRRVQNHKVLGTPEELARVIAEQSIHGIEITRIIVTVAFDKLSGPAQEALIAAERAGNIKLDFFAERLGLTSRNDAPDDNADTTSQASSDLFQPGKTEFVVLGHYRHFKRVADVTGAILFFVCLIPLIALVALLVLLDVGLPLTFHQQRPGRFGHPFQLYKFRTMSGAHDDEGRRIPDSARESALGRFIRRWRLDELPQLYNILAGEMSFVGPRPLLPVDQPDQDTSRLLVRPGLTGWAQVNGGRNISIADKTALDVWYLVHASFWLDMKIMLRTFVMLVSGEHRNRQAIARAWEHIEGMKLHPGVEHDRPVTETNPCADEALQQDAT